MDEGSGRKRVDKTEEERDEKEAKQLKEEEKR